MRIGYIRDVREVVVLETIGALCVCFVNGGE